MQESKGDLKRIVRLFFGLFLYAVGIVMTIHANLGAAPWDVFHLGVAKHLGISLGVTSIAVSVTLVLISAFMKEHVGFGTLCNMIFIGVFIDVIRVFDLIPELDSLPWGVLMLVAGLFVIALASVFYMGAGYGSGPRDSVMVVLAKRTGKTAGFCRTCTEGVVLIAGWLLGGKVGIGTVISVFGIGFAVQIVFKLCHFDVENIRQESFRETFARFFGRKA